MVLGESIIKKRFILNLSKELGIIIEESNYASRIHVIIINIYYPVRQPMSEIIGNINKNI